MANQIAVDMDIESSAADASATGSDQHRSGDDRVALCHNEETQNRDEMSGNTFQNPMIETTHIDVEAICTDSRQNSIGTMPPPYNEIPGTVPVYSGRTSGPPPSYDDVINPDAPPPTYSSLFGQVREARKNSRGLLEFLKKLVIILLGTLGVTILISFTVIIPVTMILVGSIHLNDCNAENIPTFLLVGGIVWMLKNLINIYSTCRKASPDLAEEADIQARHRRHESLLNCFLFGWFIAGCVLVYRVYLPNFDDPLSPDYCNRTVYLYAFWLVTSTFIIFGLFMGCLCCLTITTIVASNETENSAD